MGKEERERKREAREMNKHYRESSKIEEKRGLSKKGKEENAK